MPRKHDSWAARLSARLLVEAERLSPKVQATDAVRVYREDPVEFAKQVLGIWPSRKQCEILRSVSKGQRVAVASGHKVGKSTSLAMLALWFYCSFPGARVVITATTDRQVNGIIWREIKRLVRNSRLPIPGAYEIKIRAAGGLDDPSNFAEIRGYTAKEAEAIAGISGEYILYLVDEASGVAPEIFEAIEGNRAAGNAWVFLISNPTRASGEFFDAFHSKSSQYITIHIDSRESPNVTGEWREMQVWDRDRGEWLPRTSRVPGLASPEWVAEKLRDWGEDDPIFKVRVAGSFCVAEEAKVFQLALITAAQEKWADTEPTGPLQIGVDPAGDGDGGDESGFCARRGYKVLELRARSGLSPAGHVVILQELIAEHGDGTTPIVTVESEGEAGWKVYVFLKEHAERTGEFRVMRVRTSDRAIRQPLIYDRVREELWANARTWVKEGGTFPPHAKLEKDLHAPEFSSDIRGRLKLTPKRELRILLGRSPDLGDAFVLSLWEPRGFAGGGTPIASPRIEVEIGENAPTMDPWAGLDAWRPR